MVGYGSQKFGRRFSIIVICVIGGALLYPYTYTSTHALIAAAFFEQFCVQGTWGVIPIHLMELSPGYFRTFVVGTSYQLGNLASSASSTIEATIGTGFPLPLVVKEGKTVKRYDYGKVMHILLGCVYAYVILLTFVGPERRNRSFEVAQDSDMAEVTRTDLRQQRPEQIEHGVVNSSDEYQEKAGATARVGEHLSAICIH